MNLSNSADYYVGRERHERDLADTASNPAIAAIHREMADRYAELILMAGKDVEASGGDVNEETS